VRRITGLLAIAAATGTAAALARRLVAYEIADHSMEPGLRPGDWVLGLRCRDARRGQVVVFDHPQRPGFKLVKHHLWVLWTDYFKPPHVEQFPQLHDLFWRATKKAGDAKKTMDPAVGDELLALIDEIAVIFWKTKKG